MSVPPSPGHFSDFYSLKSRIGKGAYAVVFECVHKESNEAFAVKVVDKTKAGPKDIDDLAHEINIISQIGYHPHVVQMIEYFSTERHLYIVLDLLSGGMLFDRIVQLKHYSERNAAELVRNFLSALGHIHSKGIIHRDLKPENLLLRHNENSAPNGDSHLTDVCLSDFGLAGYVPSSTCCGSPSYIAPEVINVGYYLTRSEPYDAKCDIWSLGVITYILLSGKMPFLGANYKETFSRIVAGSWSFAGSIWSKITPSAKDFISQCLQMDPRDRPAVAELLKHPWISERQPDVHLEDSLEEIKKFNAHKKIRAAVRVFCWTQQLLGRQLDRTPPFMRYLRHKDKYSTVVYHQSQTDPKLEHAVDFAKVLEHDKADFRMQDCCTCPSEKVCRHIQNVHEYLFVGCRKMEVYPFINELSMLKAEAEADLEEDPNDKKAAAALRRIEHIIEAACVFSDELAKVPPGQLKPNLMLDASRNSLFRERGGSRSMTAEALQPAGAKTAVRKLMSHPKSLMATQQRAEGAAGESERAQGKRPQGGAVPEGCLSIPVDAKGATGNTTAKASAAASKARPVSSTPPSGLSMSAKGKGSAPRTSKTSVGGITCTSSRKTKPPSKS